MRSYPFVRERTKRARATRVLRSLVARTPRISCARISCRSSLALRNNVRLYHQPKNYSQVLETIYHRTSNPSRILPEGSAFVGCAQSSCTDKQCLASAAPMNCFVISKIYSRASNVYKNKYNNMSPTRNVPIIQTEIALGIPPRFPLERKRVQSRLS